MTVEFTARGWTRHVSLPRDPVPYLDSLGGEDCPAGADAVAAAE